jgi:energy-coupling factor transport system permease protein
LATAQGLRNASLGRYWPVDSPVHRLDPRAKLLAAALLVLAIALAGPWGVTLGLAAALMAMAALARLPATLLARAVRPLVPVLLVLGLFQVLFGAEPTGVPGAGVTVLAWGNRTLSAARFVYAGLSLLRLASFVFLVALLTGTTATAALGSGLEMLLRPLNRVGLPGHELALVGAIALRFMPIFGEELEAVQRAQMARDVSPVRETRWAVARNARRMAALVVPLFADAFRRVDEMTTAMLARCYQGGRGRTYLHEYRLAARDYGALAVCAALLAVTLVV